MANKDDLGALTRQWHVTVLVTDDGDPTPLSRKGIVEEVERQLNDPSAGVHASILRVRLVRR